MSGKPFTLLALALLLGLGGAGGTPVAAALPQEPTPLWRGAMLPEAENHSAVSAVLAHAAAALPARRPTHAAASAPALEIGPALAEPAFGIVLAAAEAPDAATPDSLQSACTSGDAASCRELGLRYFAGRGVAKDLARAAHFFAQACDGGYADGCHSLGFSYYTGSGVLEDQSRARLLYRQACEGGSANGCYILGRFYHGGHGVPQDPGRYVELLARAIQLYRQACDGGDASACNQLGDRYQSGEGVTEDLGRAAALFRQACDGGDAYGCNTLGKMVYQGDIVPKDLARAADLYQQACDGGLAQGCNSVGVLHERGEGVPKDLARATKHYQQACDAGSAWGCNAAGNQYYNGGGVAKDLALAAELYRQACVGGLAQGCNSVGVLHERGEGVTKDLARATELYRQACDGGVEAACSAGQRAATGAAREAQIRALAERKEQLRQELMARVDAWLSRSGVIENVADALDVDRQRTLVQLAAGHRMRITVSPANFENGRFVIQQRFGATNLDQAAGDTAFSWDRWLQMTQNSSRGVWTVYCRFTPDQAAGLQEGESIVVKANLVATNENFGNNMVVDCAR